MTLDVLESLGIDEATLSNAAISIARESQKEKNGLTARLAIDLREIEYDFIKRGAGRSSMVRTYCNKRRNEYDAAVAALLDDLQFKLSYLGDAANGGNGGADIPYSYPYNPDYSLDEANRYYVVRDYYMQISDPVVRYELFRNDPLAPGYMGRFYATLHDRLLMYAEDAS